jgi:hypothetical protein
MLRNAEGAAVPLRGVHANGRLESLVFELTVEQRYRNDTTKTSRRFSRFRCRRAQYCSGSNWRSASAN